MIQFYARYIFVFLAALLLQAVVNNAIQIRGWKPDLVLIVLVMFALQHGKIAGSTAGFFVGALSDLMSWSLLGLGALSKTVTGYVAAAMGKLVPERNQFIITLFFCGFLHDVIFNFINTLGKEIQWWVLFIGQIIPNLLYTAIVGVVVHFFLERWLTGYE